MSIAMKIHQSWNNLTWKENCGRLGLRSYQSPPQEHQMKKRIVAIIITTLFAMPFILYGAGVVTVKKTDTKTYKRVKLSHELHRSKGVTKCKQCHHKGPVNKSWASSGCHQGPGGTSKIHQLCKNCHKQRNGPTKCGECHKYWWKWYNRINKK